MFQFHFGTIDSRHRDDLTLVFMCFNSTLVLLIVCLEGKPFLATSVSIPLWYY